MKSQKRIASYLLKCGTSRIKINDQEETSKAITREDIRDLIKNNAIKKIQKKGTSKKYSSKRFAQKKKGRRKGTGSKKGCKGARNPKKPNWIKNIRAQRVVLKEMKDKKIISNENYNTLYRRSKGGMFRSKRHLISYIKERGMKV